MDSNAVLIDKLVSIMTPIFLKFHVVNSETKRQVAAMILTNADVVDWFTDKYTLLDTIEGKQGFLEKANELEAKRRVVTVRARVDPREQAILVTGNADIELSFDPSYTVVHTMAYVQRQIATQRALSRLKHTPGRRVCDFGGNFLSHARAKRTSVHSCMLSSSDRDKARIVNRVAHAEAEELLDKLDYCTDGVENCFVECDEAISMFAIPDITPEQLVRGMDAKGTSFLVMYFHYDPMMLDVSEGEMEMLQMRYTIDRKRDRINFFFVNDESFDYTHKYSDLLKYARTWTLASDTLPFVYRYQIESVQDGMAQAIVVRIHRDTISNMPHEISYRYVPRDDYAVVKSWEYDINSVRAPDHDKSYNKVTLLVPMSMFKFLYKKGMSNDTANPQKMLTVDDLRKDAQAFNQSRRVNDLVLTGDNVVQSQDLERIVRAMYALIVHDMALAQMKIGAMIDSSLYKQKRVTTGNAAIQAALLTGFTAVLPIVFIGRGLKAVVDFLTHWMKRAQQAGRMITRADMPCSYSLLPKSRLNSGLQEPGEYDGVFQGLDEIWNREQYEPVDSTSARLDVSAMCELFKDVLPEGVDHQNFPDAAYGVATPPKPYSETVYSSESVVTQSEVDTEEDLSDSELQPGVEETPEQVFNHLRESYQMARAGRTHRDTENTPIEIVKGTEVNQEFYEKILESAIYHYDCGISTLKWCRDRIHETYHGGPLPQKIMALNNAHDYGIKYLKVSAGKIVGKGIEYAVGINPANGEMLPIIVSKKGEHFVHDKSVKALMVCENLRIFNYFQIADSLKRICTSGHPVPTYIMTLKQGFPGCGKTYDIIQQFIMDDGIVVPVKKSRDKTHGILSKDPRFKGVGKKLDKKIRTVDSAIMHGMPGVRILYVDEGLMVFPGQLNALVYLTGAKEVRVYGDTMQLPPIDRSVSIGLLSYIRQVKWNSSTFNGLTARCPADVVLLLRDYYKHLGPVYTSSPILRTYEMYRITGASDRQIRVAEANSTYFCFSVTGKANLLDVGSKARGFVDGKKQEVNKGGAIVFTVHEAQGDTYGRVNYVRDNPQQNALYDSQPHMIVALSRHEFVFRCFTIDETDFVSKLIRRAMQYTDQELKAVLKPTPDWLHIKLRGDAKECQFDYNH